MGGERPTDPSPNHSASAPGKRESIASNSTHRQIRFPRNNEFQLRLERERVMECPWLGGLRGDSLCPYCTPTALPLLVLSYCTTTALLLQVIASALVWYTYQWCFYRDSLRTPLQTTRGMMDAARRAWIKKHINSGMVPVNTIRDWMSSAQFLGGQALLVAVGVSGYAVTTAGSLHGVIVLRLDGRLILFVILLALVLLQAFDYYLLLTTYYLLLTTYCLHSCSCRRSTTTYYLLLTTYYLLLHSCSCRRSTLCGLSNASDIMATHLSSSTLAMSMVSLSLRRSCGIL